MQKTWGCLDVKSLNKKTRFHFISLLQLLTIIKIYPLLFEVMQ